MLSNQSSSRRREIEIDNVKVEMLTKEESTKYLGQMVTFQEQETTEIKNRRIMAAWATFYKKQTRVDLNILPFSAPASLIRHGDHSNDEPRIRNVDTLKRTRKNDSIDAAQNTSPHHTNKKKI